MNAVLPVLAVIAAMERPVKDPGACNGCGYDAPTGNCAECGEQICTRCRNKARTDHCDGCASDLARAIIPDDCTGCDECFPRTANRLRHIKERP